MNVPCNIEKKMIPVICTVFQRPVSREDFPLEGGLLSRHLLCDSLRDAVHSAGSCPVHRPWRRFPRPLPRTQDLSMAQSPVHAESRHVRRQRSQFHLFMNFWPKSSLSFLSEERQRIEVTYGRLSR